MLAQGISSYLDYRRLAILRAEVPSVDGSISTISDGIEAALLSIRSQQLIQLQKEMHAAVTPLRGQTKGMSDADYQEKLLILEQKVEAFNQLRSTDPTIVVKALKDAHHALALSLKDDKHQLQPVYDTTIKFLNAAAQLQSTFSPDSDGKSTSIKK